jgi:hypothetical protein
LISEATKHQKGIKDDRVQKNSDLTKLIESNSMLAKANMDLAQQSLELTKNINSNEHRGNGSDVQSMRSNLLELLSFVHSKDLKFSTKQEAHAIMSKLLNDIEKGKKIIYTAPE